MKVICPKCRATANLGPKRSDLVDVHYKLECPVLRERRIAKGGDINIECLYMRRARDGVILKLRRGRKTKPWDQFDLLPCRGELSDSGAGRQLARSCREGALSA